RLSELVAGAPYVSSGNQGQHQKVVRGYRAKQDGQPLGCDHHFAQVAERRIRCCVHSTAQQSSQLTGDHLSIEPFLELRYVALNRNSVDSQNNGCHSAFDSFCKPAYCVAEAQSNPPLPLVSFRRRRILCNKESAILGEWPRKNVLHRPKQFAGTGTP